MHYLAKTLLLQPRLDRGVELIGFRYSALVPDTITLQLSFCEQPWTCVGRWVVRTTSGAAVVPDAYRLQAGDADDTTSFDNHPMFHKASLERPPRCGNALFGAGATFHSMEAVSPAWRAGTGASGKQDGRFTATVNKTELTLTGSGTASSPQNALGTPSPHSSIVVRSPGSTPHQDGRHQVYPEPQVEPLMRMNKDQDQHPRKTSPQHRSPGLRDKKPPHVDPSDK
jgi:hypothetical protein